MRYRSLFLIVLCFVWITIAAAQGVQPRNDMVVSPSWLKSKLSDRSTIVLQIARDASAYGHGHIPGARLLLLSQIAVQRDGVDNEVAPLAQLQEAFEAAGVSNDSRVVLYDDAQGMLAARAYFTLDYLGLGRRAALLDGGLERWRSEGNPLETSTPKVLRGKIRPSERTDLIVSYGELRDLASRQNPSVGPAIVDARAPQQYGGAGNAHILGARNVFWMDTIDTARHGAFKPANQISSMYANAGVKPGTKPVVYCNTGMQASHTYFTLKWMGYEPRLYDGSFQDWRRHADAPAANK